MPRKKGGGENFTRRRDKPHECNREDRIGQSRDDVPEPRSGDDAPALANPTYMRRALSEVASVRGKERRRRKLHMTQRQVIISHTGASEERTDSRDDVPLLQQARPAGSHVNVCSRTCLRRTTLSEVASVAWEERRGRKHHMKKR